jgi:ribulose bisphosphate carboxylase small subunit
MPAMFAVANYGMSVKRGPVMAMTMTTSVIEDFTDQIRVCADQGWKINIFIRYIAPFP